jgi:pimeloyl-ACP methyl ester carboxylesterase
VPAEVAESSFDHVAPQSGRPFDDAWPLDGWPDVPTRMVIGTGDRLFPPDLQRRVAAERLGVVPDELDSGHLPALSRPDELAALLLRYEQER